MTAERLDDNHPTLAPLNEALEAVGIFVATEVRDGALHLSGEVDSEGDHQAALDLATAVADQLGVAVDDNLEVIDIEVFGEPDPHETTDDRLIDGMSGAADTVTDVGTVDAGEASDEAIPYFPPTDPVVRDIDADPALEVIGGFQPTSMAGDADPAAPTRGDEQIVDDVLRELREDALTTELAIEVRAVNGVVALLGEVPSLDDAENAEAVAGRVPGVVEVRESLAVRGLRADRER